MQPRGSRLVLAIAVTAALVAVLALSAGPLAALPALLAFVPLFAGRYPGAKSLDRLIAMRSAAIDCRAARRPDRPRVARGAATPRGSRLIAFALAKRPPPVLRLS